MKEEAPLFRAGRMSQDLGTIDPEWFQTLCDSISYRDVFHYDRKWIRTLWPELEYLDYRRYIKEAELCSNLVFKQKSFLNNFYTNHIISVYDLALEDKPSVVFKLRIDRRYKNEFKVKPRIVEGKPNLKVSYKSRPYKEYLEQRDPRCESTLNIAKDLGLKMQDLEGIRDA